MGVVKDSIRFFHKFDPVPSSLFYLNMWAHQTTESLMLYDFPTSSCNTKGPECAVLQTTADTKTLARSSSGWKTNKNFISEMKTMEKNIHNLLCGQYDVIPSAKLFKWDEGFVYYSYMNMFNPMPC